MRKGITDEGSTNYDLFKLACRVSSKRLYPNFLNTSSSFNDPYVVVGHPETLVATMGPVAGDSIITVKSTDYILAEKTLKAAAERCIAVVEESGGNGSFLRELD